MREAATTIIYPRGPAAPVAPRAGCADCGQDWSRALDVPGAKRCPACRWRRRAQREQAEAAALEQLLEALKV
jgi:hypothetical protein